MLEIYARRLGREWIGWSGLVAAIVVFGLTLAGWLAGWPIWSLMALFGILQLAAAPVWHARGRTDAALFFLALGVLIVGWAGLVLRPAGG